jgi:hypothetical protein
MNNGVLAWKLLLTILTAAFAGLPLTMEFQTTGELDQQAIEGVLHRFVEA